MSKDKYWTEIIDDILANVHPSEIESYIIPNAIDQVISDYEDYIELFKGGESSGEIDEIKLHKILVKKWKQIKKRVKD